MPDEKRNKYLTDYHRKNYKTIAIMLSYERDSDVLEVLDNAVPTQTEYIKRLIRADMNRS